MADITSENVKSKSKKQHEEIEANLKRKDNIVKGIFADIFYIGLIFVFCFLFIHFVAQRIVVSGQSMTNTLQDRDQLIMDKISYKFTDPERFDVIVFPFQYEKDTFYIKRVIGLPGETVQIDDDGNIYINGRQLIENYGKEIIQDGGMAKKPITLKEDEYFVLGDNRNGSEDSRFSDVGPIAKKQIVGKALVRIYPNPGLIDDLKNYSDKTKEKEEKDK